MIDKNDFVSREWLIAEYHRRHQGPPGGALKMIEEAPAAGVEPKRKPGHWAYNPGDNIPYCSECLMPQDSECNYCPSCGAKMLPEPPEENKMPDDYIKRSDVEAAFRA